MLISILQYVYLACNIYYLHLSIHVHQQMLAMATSSVQLYLSLLLEHTNIYFLAEKGRVHRQKPYLREYFLIDNRRFNSGPITCCDVCINLGMAGVSSIAIYLLSLCQFSYSFCVWKVSQKHETSMACRQESNELPVSRMTDALYMELS